MIDAALIAKCADPSLTPAIVEQFIAAAGSDDPLATTIRSEGRLVLVPRPTSPDEALNIMMQHVGWASVRIGITQFPAGVGINDVGQLDVGLTDACENLRRGTALFAKIGRIVTKWYGNPTSKDVLPQMVADAIYAWKTGGFEGIKVFQAEDPGGATFMPSKALLRTVDPKPNSQGDRAAKDGDNEVLPVKAVENAGSAEMRIDLSRIGG